MGKETKLENLEPCRFDRSVTMGCDPEFFFVDQEGNVVGSEKVIPKKGVMMSGPSYSGYGYYDDYEDNPVAIVDGVQGEINPMEGTCRALLADDIHLCFRALRREMKKAGKQNLTLSFDPLVNITKKELDSLSPKSKVFGCAPSRNVYFKRGAARIQADPKKYLKRSAGGHIHLGADDYDRRLRNTLRKPELIVPLLDLVVANTCVLIDRHPGNKERRVNYGRVGEYRVKPYGVEYRTLSNFWLNAYQLMSLVMGLCRMTVEIASENKQYVKLLMNAVPREDVIKAVQENDFDLAYENFKKIEPILLQAAGTNEYDVPISRAHIAEFHYFVQKVKDYGLKYWFKFDPFKHWCSLPDGHDRGWESFCYNRISKEMNSKKAQATALKNMSVDLNKPLTFGPKTKVAKAVA